ncbi:hypothetical protein C8P63_10931 [Melghirimyces profundicolus]|uniref:Uncharacterized protein n=1 Tax=Melghirimyces profundicolus TaxID=1242148 RepID=A0A2T6BWD1_9BACL|nr:hypothetical protein [Melghirimyces profundicolus]PTX60267.1 hypothetical protein C8P63_10931 [Melghirimyces profundicolus]
MAANGLVRRGMVFLAGVTVLVSGCSSDDGDRVRAEKEEKPEVKVASEPTASEENLKTESTPVWKAWKTSDGKVMAHGAAEIKNKGKKPIRFDSARLNFLGKDGRVLATEEVLSVVPKVIQPGESAYVGGTVQMEPAKKPEELREVTVNADFHPTYRKPVKLKTEGLQTTESVGERKLVTGQVSNPNGETVKDVLIVTALKDSRGKLVAVVGDYLNTGIPPGGQTGFTARDDRLPPELTDQATQAEAHAYPLFTGEDNQ